MVSSLGSRLIERVGEVYLQFLNLLKVSSGIVVVGIFVQIATDVLGRPIGLRPWQASSVLVEYGLLWFTMLTAPWLTRHKGHVFIDAVTVLLPRSIQKIIAKFVYLSCMLFSLVIFYYSLRLLMTAINEGRIDTRAVDMPLWSLIAPIPLCFLLVAIEFLRFLLGYDSMYSSRGDVREGA